ncbi:hypothetical protein Pyrde_0728 [Pyrodictium delaneyi]|uniref:Uncharacterized protein n=1 Tax=Pyrodictium delaneyi TaxID=1273541 RepID=A0A0P0N3C5_9CREN|nr:hypothetical protein [Pyrodictium delaneyi]ALL00778.1 hypothetical protein Pyrde_0728 [Pyrodictium delaneyi]
MGRSKLRGVSYVVAAIALTIVSIVAAYGIYSWAQGQVSSMTHGSLDVTVKPITLDDETHLVIALRNSGGSAIKVLQVYIDGTRNITSDLGLPKSLGPGDEHKKTIDLDELLPGGKHVIKVVYEEGGKTKEDEFSFQV